MTVIIQIQGREAIPVRAIPLLTDWSITPLTAASMLAQTEPLIRMESVFAYEMKNDQLSVRMLPKSWDCIEADIAALSEKYRALEVTPNECYSLWRRDSIKTLPAGVFVWKDEFEAEWGSLVGYSVPTRTGDNDLNFSPFIDSEMQAIVMEGFVTCDAPSTAAPLPVVAASDGPAPLPAVANWKMRVQAEAAELFLRLLASGANPTQHSLIGPMAQWCRDNEVKTDTGINPSEGYLRTHVLGGGYWTAPTMTREQAKKHVAQVAQTKVAQVAQ